MTRQSDDLPVLVIDGARFSDFDGFTREFSRLLDNYVWRGNLDAFNDLLRGGFGTPENGWVLRWRNSELSCSALGYEAAIQRLEQVLLTCRPSNRSRIEGRIRRARRSRGPSCASSAPQSGNPPCPNSRSLSAMRWPGGHAATSR